MSTGVDFVTDWLEEFRAVLSWSGLPERIARADAMIRDVKARRGKLLFAGNGASASIASHYALDFTKQVGARSVAFTDPSFITAYVNDYGQEKWVARAIEHHADEGDLAVLISTSGSSANVVHAAKQCQAQGVPVLAFTGFAESNPLNGLATVGFWAESRSYNVVESVHSAWLGLLCDKLIGAREYGVKG